jgi:DNA repair exonuclease SbcCD ATPase subunit
MIKFRKLVIKNFMSFGKRVEIPLYKQGVIRIEGKNLDEVGGDSNGSGKSAIIEALIWCLFGRTIRGLKHDKVVNRFKKKDCSVSIRLSSGSETYTVRRFRRDRKNGNRLCLWNGKRPISFRHEDDTQKRLEEIIGCNFDSFVNSVVFGGVRPFASLSDSDQKKLLESFLHFEQFDEALKRTKALISEKEEAQQENRVAIEKSKGHASSYRERLKTLRAGEKLFAEESGRRLKHAVQKARSLRRHSGERWNKKLLQRQIQKGEDRLEAIRAKSARYQAKVNLYSKELRHVRSAIESRASLVGKSCPTCGTTISKGTIAAYLEHLLSEKRQLKARLRRYEEKLAIAQKEVKHGVQSLKDLHENYQTVTIKLSLFHEAEEEVWRLKKKLKAATSSASILEVEIAETSIKYSKALSRQLILEQKQASLEREIEDLRFWEIGFGNKGIKALIIREALPALNAKLEEYAHEIFGGKADLKFLPAKTKKSGGETELFNVSYISKGGANSYIGESTGRKRRADICILLVFSWLSRTCNIIFVDELLDGLDSIGREDVMRILTTQKRSTFVVSHRWDIKSKNLGSVWIVIKEHGYSHVEIS